MKVSNRGPIEPATGEAARRPAAAPESTTARNEASARVQISETARLLAGRRTEDGTKGEDRVARILDLKKAIESGAYHVDARDVAKSLVKRNFLDLVG